MIRYLSEKEIIILNSLQIKKFSPKEQIGVKEPTALNMCVEQPKQHVFGQELYPTIEDKAAILFELLVNKHCFYNANKRTALISLIVFLKLNGIQLIADNKSAEEFTVSIAAKRGIKAISHEHIVAWIKDNTTSLK
jgi:death on curing protein